ncbi:MAG TPA: sulfite exporter TauE/SafE family protein [Candidatus Obscuribacterales bacterium]
MFLLAIAVSFTATFIGSVSGGSTSVITLPCWLSFGFPLPTAVAADKTAGALWTAVASRNYLRGKQLDWPLILGLSGFGIIGAVLGTRVTVSVDPQLLKRVVGGIILTVVAIYWVKKEFGLETTAPAVGRFTCSIFGFPLGFYEGILGSGNSLISSLTLCKSRGFDLLTSLGHSYLVAFAWCAAAAIAYSGQGFFNWSLTIPAIIGSVLGAQTGSMLGSRMGAKPVKILFSVAGVFFGGKLLLGL